ncbi:WD40 repeat-like protein [Meredithblackwellia eburnea MCA 4105]
MMTTPVPQPAPLSEKEVTKQSLRVVAHFLDVNGYQDTLAAFKREAEHEFKVKRAGEENLEPDEDQIWSDLTSVSDLRHIVEDYLERKRRAALVAPSAAKVEEQFAKMTIKTPLPTKVTKTIRDTTNVLTLQNGTLPRRRWDSSAGRFVSEFIPAVFSTAVDRALKIYSVEDWELLDSHPFPSPILSSSFHPKHSQYVVVGTMEGSIHLLDLVSREVKQKIKDHTKYIVKTVWSDSGEFVATLGYDRSLNIYKVVASANSNEHALLDGEEPDELAETPNISLELLHTHTHKSNPEAAVFLPGSSYLVFTARDDNILHYIQLPILGAGTSSNDFTFTGFNLNENQDAWVSFSVLSMSIHPSLPILCLQTSTENARILLYPFHTDRRITTLFTTAEQSEFFTPRHAWTPDGTAVLVNSEDGVVRVVDLQGKVRARIGAHGAAGPLEEDEDEIAGRLERVRIRREGDRGSSVVKDVAVLERTSGVLTFVSCGFDKTIRVVTV